MATKSKKSKLYRLRYKGIAVFLFFTFAVSIFFCGIVGVNISRNWSWDVINADTVYDTEEFREAFSRTLDRAVQADIYYQSEDRVSKGAAVDRNDLLNGFKRYYGIIDGIITGNTEINAAYDGLLLHGEIPESLQGNLEEYRNLVESRLPAYYKMYIQRQLDEYKNCIRYLAGVRNFLYYVEDENGNVVGGNAAKGEISQEARTLVLSAATIWAKIRIILIPTRILFWKKAISNFTARFVTPCCRGMNFMTCGRASASQKRASRFFPVFRRFPFWGCCFPSSIWCG